MRLPPDLVVIASDRLGRRSVAEAAGKRGNLVAWHAEQTEIASLTLALTTGVGARNDDGDGGGDMTTKV